MMSFRVSRIVRKIITHRLHSASANARAKYKRMGVKLGRQGY